MTNEEKNSTLEAGGGTGLLSVPPDNRKAYPPHAHSVTCSRQVVNRKEKKESCCSAIDLCYNERMANSLTQATNSIVLKQFSDRLDRISVDSLNEEGQYVLKEIKEKVENLYLLFVAEKFLESIGE